jgi:hypothetical protein
MSTRRRSQEREPKVAMEETMLMRIHSVIVSSVAAAKTANLQAYTGRFTQAG